MKNVWHDISPGDNAPGTVNVIIEISKDSQVKYEIDKETGLLKLDRFIYSASHYPGDYGFIPRTFWEDGDPLDILVLTSRPVMPMTLAEARPIGVMRMLDGGDKDDKIIAVYEKDPRFKEFDDLKHVPKHIIDEIKHFFETYKQLQKKEVKVTEILDKKKAHETIKKGIELYNKKFKK